MRAHLIRLCSIGVALAAAGVPLAAAAPASGASAALVANWQMNEAAGATQMTDTSGNGLHGQIGADVLTGQTVAGTNRAYRFVGKDAQVVNDGRLVTVPDDPRLDPGIGTYAVTVRFRTPLQKPNILQKGQAGQTGGYWKVVLHNGWPRCHFRDETGKTLAIGFVDDPRPETKASSNTWRTLRCARTTTGVTITLDPDSSAPITRSLKGTIGKVDNSRPLSIGGKVDCDSELVGCDYLYGYIDWVRIERPAS